MTAANGQGCRQLLSGSSDTGLQKKSSRLGFQHQQPIVRRDLQREAEFEIEQPNVEERIRSYRAVPFIARGESVGVMIVLISHRNAYSGEHAEFLQAISISSSWL